MHLILPNQIANRESFFSRTTIIKAAQKALQGLGQDLKNTQKIPNTQLTKIPVTTPDGAGRIIFLVLTKKQDAIFIMSRPKKDKKIGTNMSSHNPKFTKALETNLDLIINDLQTKNFEKINLNN